MSRGRRIMAARYLRTLSTIECLSALGNDDEVRRLLAGIDPIEARELANEIEDDLPRIGAARRPVTSPPAAPVSLSFHPESLRA